MRFTDTGCRGKQADARRLCVVKRARMGSCIKKRGGSRDRFSKILCCCLQDSLRRLSRFHRCSRLMTCSSCAGCSRLMTRALSQLLDVICLCAIDGAALPAGTAREGPLVARFAVLAYIQHACSSTGPCARAHPLSRKRALNPEANVCCAGPVPKSASPWALLGTVNGEMAREP